MERLTMYDMLKDKHNCEEQIKNILDDFLSKYVAKDVQIELEKIQWADGAVAIGYLELKVMF